MKLLIDFPYHPDRFHIESVEQRAALVEAFKNAKEMRQVDLDYDDRTPHLSDGRSYEDGTLYIAVEAKP